MLAVGDFIETLPDGKDEYTTRELAALARRLYTRASPPGATYFVDKTPAIT